MLRRAGLRLVLQCAENANFGIALQNVQTCEEKRKGPHTERPALTRAFTPGYQAAVLRIAMRARSRTGSARRGAMLMDGGFRHEPSGAVTGRNCVSMPHRVARHLAPAVVGAHAVPLLYRPAGHSARVVVSCRGVSLSDRTAHHFPGTIVGLCRISLRDRLAHVCTRFRVIRGRPGGI